MKKLISFSVFVSIVLIMVFARTTASAQQVVVRSGYGYGPAVVARPFYPRPAFVYARPMVRPYYYRPMRYGVRFQTRQVIRRGRYCW